MYYDLLKINSYQKMPGKSQEIIKISVVEREGSREEELLLSFYEQTYKINISHGMLSGANDRILRRKGQDGIIFLVDMTDKEALITLRNQLHLRDRFWCPEIPLLIVGTKNDHPERVLSEEAIADFLKRNGCNFPYMVCSAEKSENFKNFDEVFSKIKEEILKKKQIAYEKAHPKSDEDLYKEAYDDFKTKINMLDHHNDSNQIAAGHILLNEINKLKNSPSNKDPKKLQELTDILQDGAHLIERPSVKATQNFIEKSKTVEGKTSIGKRVAGAMLILAGTILIGLSIALTVHTLGASLIGTKAGLNLILAGTSGLCAVSSTCCVFFSNKQKGLSKAMNKFAIASNASISNS